MMRGPATTQTHWVKSAAGASPPSACSVGLSAATGSDRCHAVTQALAGLHACADNPSQALNKITPLHTSVNNGEAQRHAN